MPYHTIKIHCVWATKYRQPTLLPHIRPELWNCMKDICRKHDIHFESINGHKDHCHCLLSPKPDQSISEIVRKIKGASSFWLNNQSGFFGDKARKFAWQDDYFVESVSPSDVFKVKRYIEGQEDHHKVIGFEEEYERLIASIDMKIGLGPRA